MVAKELAKRAAQGGATWVAGRATEEIAVEVGVDPRYVRIGFQLLHIWNASKAVRAARLKNAQVRASNARSGAPKSVSPQVKQVGDQVKQFLGKDARVITNEAGDTISLSKDGLRRVRFDINRPNPHLNPHSHVEIKVDGKWIKSGPIYPKDVTPK